MALPIFPLHRLSVDSITPTVRKRTISGGTSISGEEDVIQTDGGGRIEVTVDGVQLDDPETQRLWNAWDAYLSGGVNECLVPLVTLGTGPRPWAGNLPVEPSVIGDNDDTYPTIVAYRAPLIRARLNADAALRATTLSVSVEQGSALQGGEWFSIGERAYRIERVIARAGMAFTIRTDPPLREAVTAGTLVEFEWPVVKARLSPGTSLIAPLMIGMYGDASAQFVEVR